MNKYTEAEQNQIKIFGHVLPASGGSYTFTQAEGLKKVPDPPLDLESQPGMIKQPTAITAADMANDHTPGVIQNGKATPAPAPKV